MFCAVMLGLSGQITAIFSFIVAMFCGLTTYLHVEKQKDKE